MEHKGFFESIYEIVCKIPEGRVVSYGQIAKKLGRPNASRIVGYAMRQAPNGRNLPCHRVVRKDGSLAPYHVFGEEDFQRLLLLREGVEFNADGNIDMKHCTWDIE